MLYFRELRMFTENNKQEVQCWGPRWLMRELEQGLLLKILWHFFFFVFLKCKVGEFIEIEKCKVAELSPQSWGEGPKGGCLRNDVIWGFYPFSPGCCSVTMLIRYAESSSLVGCTCNFLIGQSLCPAFLPFHPLRSQGGHNGGIEEPFLLSHSLLWRSNPNCH
jgi:hypothetical protein